MARVAINTGASANDGTGTNLRSAGGILNSNFLELYTYLGAGSTTVLSAPLWSSTNAGINTLRNVGIGTTNPRFSLEVGAVGASGTTLFVNGDARVTGIVTIGPASITLNGITNIINVGTGITINGSTGIISATAIVLGGTTLTGAGVTFITAGSGISVNQGTGNVTITAIGTGSTSQWVTTAAGIHTLSNVGVGTTNPTSKLTVTGNGTFTGVVTATTFVGALTGTATTATNAQGLTGTPNITVGVATATTFVGALTGTATTATNAQGLTGTPNITVGVATASTLNVGTSGTVITTTTAGLVGIGTTNPTKKLTVSGDALINGLTVGLGSGAITSNTAIGYVALNDNTSGGNNTADGYGTLNRNTTGDFNTSIGSQSLSFNTTGNRNTAIGAAALGVITTGNDNTAAGYLALYDNTGTNNTGIGISAGITITTGSKNTLLGSYTGNQNGLDIRTSSNNVVLSDGDGNIRFYANSSGNVGIGSTNPTKKLTVSGDALINGLTVGLGSGAVTTNTAVGAGALYSNTSGYQNTANGHFALYSNATGYGNVATGGFALIFNTTGQENTATGYGALNETTGSKNSAFGAAAGTLITTGGKNTILGTYNGNQNGLDIRTSSNNVVLSDGDGNIRFYANSSGNVGLGTTNPIEKLTVVGVTSSTSFYGDASYTASGRWTLGADGSSNYTFVGIGFTQTTNDPVLYLARGRVYEFVNNSGGSHPFQIRVSNGGSAYSDGVTNNGAASGVIRFEIPFNAPNTLYYQCTNHAGMGNTISVYPNTI
jgi:hypothetical protein